MNISDKKGLDTSQLAKIVEFSQDAIFTRELDGTIVSWNKGAESMIGYAPNEIIGQNISKIIPEKNVKVVNEDSKKLSKGGTIDKFEGEFIRKGGTVFVGSIKVSLMKTEENGKILVSLIVRDLTEDKNKIREIEKLSLALEQSSSAVVTTNLLGTIEYVNKKFEKMTGYSSDEIIGKNTNILNSITQEKEFYDNILNMIEVKNEFIGEMATTNSNGELLWVRVALSPIKELYDKTIGFLAVMDDITEKKNLIDDLNKKNKELEDAFKLLKNTQVQLMNDNKMASIGQLSAGIAHEINNPLGFVLSNFSTLKKYVSKFKNTIEGYRNYKDIINHKYKEMLSGEIKDIEKIENINKIDYILGDLDELFSETEEGLERIRNIVLALRNFAHENINGSFEEYDLNDGVKNTLTIARNELKYTSEVKLNLGEIPIIRAIGSEINQVLLNMIVNSSQAIKEKIEKNNITSDKYGEILIWTYCENNQVCFLIQDNGIGIPKELLNRVFEPFFTTKPVGKGTGLGLSISYEIIKNKHKGEIQIESTAGLGTKITIKLPLL